MTDLERPIILAIEGYLYRIRCRAESAGTRANCSLLRSVYKEIAKNPTYIAIDDGRRLLEGTYPEQAQRLSQIRYALDADIADFMFRFNNASLPTLL